MTYHPHSVTVLDMTTEETTDRGTEEVTLSLTLTRDEWHLLRHLLEERSFRSARDLWEQVDPQTESFDR